MVYQWKNYEYGDWHKEFEKRFVSEEGWSWSYQDGGGQVQVEDFIHELLLDKECCLCKLLRKIGFK